ncbi:hypothetical protein BU15DRAFT_64172 [Melanogaster broomeanus]|nr:hypothetical protein BU15DRAFT_64172 [Melanogaster broomeanus]
MWMITHVKVKPADVRIIRSHAGTQFQHQYGLLCLDLPPSSQAKVASEGNGPHGLLHQRCMSWAPYSTVRGRDYVHGSDEPLRNHLEYLDGPPGPYISWPVPFGRLVAHLGDFAGSDQIKFCPLRFSYIWVLWLGRGDQRLLSPDVPILSREFLPRADPMSKRRFTYAGKATLPSYSNHQMKTKHLSVVFTARAKHTSLPLSLPKLSFGDLELPGFASGSQLSMESQDRSSDISHSHNGSPSQLHLPWVDIPTAPEPALTSNRQLRWLSTSNLGSSVAHMDMLDHVTNCWMSGTDQRKYFIEIRGVLLKVEIVGPLDAVLFSGRLLEGEPGIKERERRTGVGNSMKAAYFCQTTTKLIPDNILYDTAGKKARVHYAFETEDEWHAKHGQFQQLTAQNTRDFAEFNSKVVRAALSN